jgi:hypothetical protein
MSVTTPTLRVLCKKLIVPSVVEGNVLYMGVIFIHVTNVDYQDYVLIVCGLVLVVKLNKNYQ